MTPFSLMLGLTLAGDLSDLEARFREYPDDYATAAALGRAAVEVGDGELALEAWRRAVELSGGNFESAMGRVLALTAAGRHSDARLAADALVEAHPDNPAAWSTRAWAWRWEPTLPQRSALKALRSYEEALQRGASGDVYCGLGYTRRALGDTLGARAAFIEADSSCGRGGLARTPRGWRAWGSVSGGLTGYTNHLWRESGNHAGAQVGARWADTVGADISARRVTANGSLPDPDGIVEGEPGPPPVVEATVGQTELWARAGGRGSTFGADVLVGLASIDGDESGSARAVGGRAWKQVSPVTLGLSGISTTYDDGDQLQLGIDVELPIQPSSALMAGLDHTRLTGSATYEDSSGEATTVDLSDRGMSGWVAGRYWFVEPDLTLTGGGRVGREVRPVRLAAPSMWNLDESLLRSAFVDIGWRIDDRFTLFGGVERVRLDDPLPDEALSPGESTLATGYLGLRVDLGPRPMEAP